jgi:hypothetical protein
MKMMFGFTALFLLAAITLAQAPAQQPAAGQPAPKVAPGGGGIHKWRTCAVRYLFDGGDVLFGRVRHGTLGLSS